MSKLTKNQKLAQEKIEAGKTYSLQEAAALVKVSWPTRSELANSAVVVLIASIIIALIVWLMDFSFENIMTFVYGLFN